MPTCESRAVNPVKGVDTNCSNIDEKSVAAELCMITKVLQLGLNSVTVDV